MKYTSRLILLIASMALPNLILGLISVIEGNSLGAILFIVFGIIGLMATMMVWYQLSGTFAGEPHEVSSIKRFNFDMFSHIVSYLPALIAFGLGTNTEIFALGIFYLFYIAMVSMSDIVVLNPILHLMGWRFRGAVLKLDDGTEEVIVITKPNARLVLGESTLKELSDFGMYLLHE